MWTFIETQEKSYIPVNVTDISIYGIIFFTYTPTWCPELLVFCSTKAGTLSYHITISAY